MTCDDLKDEYEFMQLNMQVVINMMGQCFWKSGVLSLGTLKTELSSTCDHNSEVNLEGGTGMKECEVRKEYSGALGLDVAV